MPKQNSQILPVSLLWKTLEKICGHCKDLIQWLKYLCPLLCLKETKIILDWRTSLAKFSLFVPLARLWGWQTFIIAVLWAHNLTKRADIPLIFPKLDIGCCDRRWLKKQWTSVASREDLASKCYIKFQVYWWNWYIAKITYSKLAITQLVAADDSALRYAKQNSTLL